MLEASWEGERAGSVGDSLIDCSLPRAPRRAQTGHGSLSSYNAVPQTWQARLLFVLTPPPPDRALNRFGLPWLAQKSCPPARREESWGVFNHNQLKDVGR